MDAETITRALGGTWRGNRGVALCPSHREHTPSLNISEREGTVLVHCFGGCAQADLIAELGQRGLWPQREATAKPLSREGRRRLAREAATQRIDRQRAGHWRRGRMVGLERLKAEAFEGNDLDTLEATASELWRLQQANGPELVDFWLAARRSDTAGADAAEVWGREDEAHAIETTAAAVALLEDAESRLPMYQPEVSAA